MIDNETKEQISTLRKEYERLRTQKQALLRLLDETELPEQVYNSNAIENSTLSLKETERILLELETSRNVNVRELFEAKNLGRVIEYLRDKPNLTLDCGTIKLLHKMLLAGINDNYAGRLRAEGEYVRVGRHIAPPPQFVPELLNEIIIDYNSKLEIYFLERIARFHLEFERIHPFCDGNGRIGRVLINLQLAALGYPSVIIRSKGKQKDYYPLFQAYSDNGHTAGMTLLLSRALRESLHRRLAYMRDQNIIKLTDYARSKGDLKNDSKNKAMKNKTSNTSSNTAGNTASSAINSSKNSNISAILNAAKRQTIPAFRERGVWMIGSE
ncbi:MAG: Fic family protein [Coriobacteriales bacterium]|nr:Fic family protein [Coriobacteriales bacterium]